MCPKSSCRVVRAAQTPQYWHVSQFFVSQGAAASQRVRGVFEWFEIFSKGCHVSHDTSQSVTFSVTNSVT